MAIYIYIYPKKLQFAAYGHFVLVILPIISLPSTHRISSSHSLSLFLTLTHAHIQTHIGSGVMSHRHTVFFSLPLFPSHTHTQNIYYWIWWIEVWYMGKMVLIWLLFSARPPPSHLNVQGCGSGWILPYPVLEPTLGKNPILDSTVNKKNLFRIWIQLLKNNPDST